MQVDAFELAVETPSPQQQQRGTHAAGTPLGIGLAALSIADEPPMASSGGAAGAAYSPDEERRTAAMVGIEQGGVEDGGGQCG